MIKKWIVFIVLPSESKIYKFCTFGNSHSSNHDDFVKFISKMSSKEWEVIKMNVGDRCLDYESGYYSISFINNILSGETEINKLGNGNKKNSIP